MSYHRVDREFTARNEDERAVGEQLKILLAQNLSNFGEKWDNHLPVFMTAPALARVLWLDKIYRLALDVPGRVLEFGSQWGASLNILMLLKMIYEPWNVARPIISFSTFSQGFLSVAEQDGRAGGGDYARPGDYAVIEGWKAQLEQILRAHAERSPVGAEHNFQIIEGDACKTFPQWLEQNPEALVSHAHFDMDVYEPTRDVLQQILPRMPKGVVLIFDEINCPAFPGETRAIMEILGVHNLALRKSPFQPYSAYCIIE